MGRVVMMAHAALDMWRVAALTMMSKRELNAALVEDPAWVRSAAALGITSAQVRLGRMLLEGEGVAQNRVQAFTNFCKAAAKGDIEGHNMLGRCYENGWGTSVNHVQASHHYGIAAEAGLDWAQYNLGHMRLSGYGGSQNHQEAFCWYNRSAQQGHVRAMNLVGRCHEQGWGTPCNATAALDWYRRSARGGYFRGAFNYASLLCETGCEWGAVYWFRRALESAGEPSLSHMKLSLSCHISATVRALTQHAQAHPKKMRSATHISM